MFVYTPAVLDRNTSRNPLDEIECATTGIKDIVVYF